MNIGIVLAGGTGTRFGSETPKQYQTICGHEVIHYAINALKNSSLIGKIIVAASDKQADRLKEDYEVEIVPNGSTRNKSLKNALNYVKTHYPTCKNVIILEAARPMITSAIVDEYLSKLDNFDSVITGQKIVDSLGSFHTHTANRSGYYLIQAPEAFAFDILYSSFDENSPLTATNQQMPEDSRLYINFGFADNFKITYFQDLAYCEALMKERNQ